MKKLVLATVFIVGITLLFLDFTGTVLGFVSRFSLYKHRIDTDKCNGCGACENLCPARPFSAIYVEGHAMHRII